MKTCQRCGRSGDRGFDADPEPTIGVDQWYFRCRNATACNERIAKAARAAVAGQCIDCVANGAPNQARPAPHPGPRCATHHRAAKKRTKSKDHGRRLEQNFGMPASKYWALYAYQGGRCFICQVATGKSRNLAVDHDHNCAAGHPKDRGCPRCWRALVCGKCNQMIGFLGIEALLRAVQVLAGNGPARQLFVMEEIDDGSFDRPASTESDEPVVKEDLNAEYA